MAIILFIDHPLADVAEGELILINPDYHKKVTDTNYAQGTLNTDS